MIERSNPSVQAARGGRVQHLHVAGVLLTTFIATVVAGVEVATGRLAMWEPWLGLVMLVATNLGITVGYHRLLSHHAFKALRSVKAVLIVLGCMAAQGPPIYWVANHRNHHRFADKEGDPHSPRWVGERVAASRWHGWWHAHVGWLFGDRAPGAVTYCQDLYQDRLVVWVNRRYHWWVALGLALPALIGALIEGTAWGAAKGLLWGGGVRLFVSYHSTQSINSFCHLFGYRSFATREHSTNNAWLALPTLGESWHNNHHACASSAVFGLRWWELDIGGLFIRALAALHLASDVARHDPALVNRLRITKGGSEE